jgi:DNA-binding NtrC family response regulator
MSVLILVVDDEADMESLFRQQFRREVTAGRFLLRFARNAEEALAIVRGETGAELILVLSDVNMPGLSGLELLPLIKTIRPDLPVVLITAYGDEGMRETAVRRGADGFFVKPIDFGAVRSEIASRLSELGRSP